jgi:hypothetical protein
MMMRLEIAVDAQREAMRRNLARPMSGANRTIKRDANFHLDLALPEPANRSYGCGLAFGSGGVVGFLSFC